MIRICTSLSRSGYFVTLVGRSHKNADPLNERPFQQKRLFCFFRKGKLFYLEYNLKLFFYLLFQPFDLIGAIDLDTILPCYWASVIKRKKRVYDAHELFCEMKEVVSRPRIYQFWKWVERNTVPHFQLGYTVNHFIRNMLFDEYKVEYEVIRNMPVVKEEQTTKRTNEKFILYQGAVNHGRSFETLIPAFQHISVPLHIYGDGNFLGEAKSLVKKYNLEEKIIFKGKAAPETLKEITPQAFLGITLFEKNSLNNYYSLANRFFDYIHAGVPQLCVAYPAYKEINEQYKVACLIEDLTPQVIAHAINNILNDDVLWEEMHQACLAARRVYNWQEEEKKLLPFYHTIFYP
ncbi:MAG: glycosyltransferase [Flavisolibacter sp.]|nr:glycosyltransferase [Flavisolibacter sp.]